MRVRTLTFSRSILELRRSLTRQPALSSTRFRTLSDPDSLREFAKNLREGIYISTRAGHLLDANRAFLEIFGVESIADLGELAAVGSFVDPSRRTAEMALLERDGSVREFEIELKRPDGLT